MEDGFLGELDGFRGRVQEFEIGDFEGGLVDAVLGDAGHGDIDTVGC